MQKYCNIVKNKLNMLIRNMEKNAPDFVVYLKRDYVRKPGARKILLVKIQGILAEHPISIYRRRRTLRFSD